MLITLRESRKKYLMEKDSLVRYEITEPSPADGNHRQASLPCNLSGDDRIFINVNKKPVLIKISDIIFVAAENQYTSLRLADGKSYLLRKSLSKWEEILPEKTFLRIHRSTIINLDYLIKMEKWSNSCFLIHLENVAEPFAVSKKYSAAIRKNAA